MLEKDTFFYPIHHSGLENSKYISFYFDGFSNLPGGTVGTDNWVVNIEQNICMSCRM